MNEPLERKRMKQIVFGKLREPFSAIATTPTDINYRIDIFCYEEEIWSGYLELAGRQSFEQFMGLIIDVARAFLVITKPGEYRWIINPYLHHSSTVLYATNGEKDSLWSLIKQFPPKEGDAGTEVVDAEQA